MEPRLVVVNWVTLKNANLFWRVTSALVLAPLVLFVVWLGGWFFALSVIAIVSLALFEWLRLTRFSEAWKLVGIPYLGGFGVAMLYLRSVPQEGAGLLYYVLAIVWGTDIGAYLFGRLIGGPKLAPRLSPNKTWAGFFGGIILAVLFGYAVNALWLGHWYRVSVGDGFTILLSGISQVGDLFESWIKRRAGVKESGHVIPGHGGILDRIDGLIFASIAFFPVVAFFRD